MPTQPITGMAALLELAWPLAISGSALALAGAMGKGFGHVEYYNKKLQELLNAPDVISVLPEIRGGASDEMKVWHEEAQMVIASLVEARRQNQLDIEDLRQRLDDADVPNVATRQIRERIGVQAARADQLHDTALRQNRLFQLLGIFSVLVGLAIIGCAAFEVIFRDLAPDKVKVIAPVAGLVFNAVGGGLLLFHRATSQTAFRYYEQKQDLDNLLTALELMTNRVMKEQTAAMMPELIRKLYAHVGTGPVAPFVPATDPSPAKAETKLEKP